MDGAGIGRAVPALMPWRFVKRGPGQQPLGLSASVAYSEVLSQIGVAHQNVFDLPEDTASTRESVTPTRRRPPGLRIDLAAPEPPVRPPGSRICSRDNT
jgi:hypothetical protein